MPRRLGNWMRHTGSLGRGSKERETVETVREEQRFGITVSRSTETITTTRELLYEDADQDDFEGKSKQAVKQSNIPKELKPHAEAFLSRLHTNISKFLPQETGDYIMSGSEPGHRVETGLEPDQHGVALRNGRVKPAKIISLLNLYYINTSGQTNKEFMDIVKTVVEDGMGIGKEDGGQTTS